MNSQKSHLKKSTPNERSTTGQNDGENPYLAISPELDVQTMGMVRTQVEKMLQSDSFLRSKRMHRFLSFTVDCALKGYSDSLNEHSIARSVFDKDDSFDPCLDPIVRIEIGRLRSKLRQYYMEEGTEDIIVIAYPKRSYIPTFRFRKVEPSTKPSLGNSSALSAIAILPFADFNSSKGLDRFCDSLTEELTNLIGRLTNLRVVARTSTFPFKGRPIDVRKIGADLGVDAFLEGSVQRGNGKIRISIGLVDVRNGYRLWTTVYDLKTNGSFNVQEVIARKIADQLNRKMQEIESPA